VSILINPFIVQALDTTPPTITSSSTVSVAENATLSHSLTADESVSWSIVGGADQSKFELSGSTLRWASNGTKDYESPDDANTDNAYVVTVRATDLASNTTDQTITVTVTDVAGIMSFVAASGTTYAVGTSQNQTIPASAATGDMLIAVIMHRDTLTAPSGWSLVDTVTGVGAVNHICSMYSRVAQAGDAGTSTTWSQATSQRICVHIMAFRKADGTPSIIDHDVTHTDSTSATTQAMAVSTATANGQMGVMAGTYSAASSSSTTMGMSVGTQTTVATVAENRLCAGYLARNNAETTAGNFTTNTGQANSPWACVSAIIG